MLVGQLRARSTPAAKQRSGRRPRQSPTIVCLSHVGCRACRERPIAAVRLCWFVAMSVPLQEFEVAHYFPSAISSESAAFRLSSRCGIHSNLFPQSCGYPGVIIRDHRISRTCCRHVDPTDPNATESGPSRGQASSRVVVNAPTQRPVMTCHDREVSSSAICGCVYRNPPSGTYSP